MEGGLHGQPQSRSIALRRRAREARKGRREGTGQGAGREGTGQGAGRGGGSGKPRDASICDELLSISEIKPNEARQPRTVNASPVMKARIHRCLVFLRLASGSKNKQRRPKRVIKTGLAVLLHDGGERTWSPPPLLLPHSRAAHSSVHSSQQHSRRLLHDPRHRTTSRSTPQHFEGNRRDDSNPSRPPEMDAPAAPAPRPAPLSR